MREKRRSALGGLLKTWKDKGSAVPDSLQHTVNFGMKSPTDTKSAKNLKYGTKILPFFNFLFHDVGASCFFFFSSPEEKQVLLGKCEYNRGVGFQEPAVDEWYSTSRSLGHRILLLDLLAFVKSSH